MFHGFRLTAALAVALLVMGPLHAQTSEPAVPMQPEAPKLDPKACTDRDRMAEGDIVGTDGRAAAEENPSDKLARTDGVICPPPGLDPHIRAPAPSAQSDMPVIRPPGSPGGSPDAQPK